MLSSAVRCQCASLIAKNLWWHTFDELAAVDLARSNLESDDVALRAVSAIPVRRNVRRTAASLRSLIGIPIVLVILAVQFALPKVDRSGGEVVRGRKIEE